MIFDRTDLRKAVFGATFDAESDFEVRLAVVPPKSTKNEEKPISENKKISDFLGGWVDVFGTTKRRLRLKF